MSWLRTILLWHQMEHQKDSDVTLVGKPKFVEQIDTQPCPPPSNHPSALTHVAGILVLPPLPIFDDEDD